VPENRLFVGSALVDQWITGGGAELVGGVLRARATGASFALEEAVHVVAEVAGAGDESGFVGRVRPVAELTARGAELLDRSMVLGDAAYDVVPGFFVTPLPLDQGQGPLLVADVAASLYRLSEAPQAGQSDEELLARYLIQKL
jgi:hypothetical protein